MKRVLFVATLCLVGMVAQSWADVDSGPKVGTTVSELKVFAATGDSMGKEIDGVKERGAKPTVYVFIPHARFDRPLARFLKGLEKEAVALGNDAALMTVFLTDEVDKTKDHLPKIQMSLQFTANPLVVYPSAKNSPNGWAVDTDAQMTAVVVKDGKVTARFGYRSANDTVVPEVAKALKEAVGK